MTLNVIDHLLSSETFCYEFQSLTFEPRENDLFNKMNLEKKVVQLQQRWPFIKSVLTNEEQTIILEQFQQHSEQTIFRLGRFGHPESGLYAKPQISNLPEFQSKNKIFQFSKDHTNNRLWLFSACIIFLLIFGAFLNFTLTHSSGNSVAGLLNVFDSIIPNQVQTVSNFPKIIPLISGSYALHLLLRDHYILLDQ